VQNSKERGELEEVVETKPEPKVSVDVMGDVNDHRDKPGPGSYQLLPKRNGFVK